MHSLPSRQYYLLQKHNIIAFAFSYCNNQLTCIYLVCRCIPYPHYNFHYTKEVVECAASSQQVATPSSSISFDYSIDCFIQIDSFILDLYTCGTVCGTIFSFSQKTENAQLVSSTCNQFLVESPSYACVYSKRYMAINT